MNEIIDHLGFFEPDIYSDIHQRSDELSKDWIKIFYRKNAEDYGREPVGESVLTKGKKMIKLYNGNKIKRTWNISSPISYSMDTKI